jgi:proteasome lid subunit RPN8/RPN11
MSEINVEISPLAFSKIIDWTSSNTEREVGGYLIGYIDKGKVIIIESTFAVSSSTPTHVQLDEMAQFRIVEEIEKRSGKETILGFWHTHPGIGCFMSGTDIATQKIYQSLLPEAVAMVNDGNKFAQSQNQNDFQAHFYRVDLDNDKYHEVSYGIITNPNDLIPLLTNHIQSEENIEKVIEKTVNSLSSQLDNVLETFADEKLMSKVTLEAELLALKKSIAKTRADIETITNQQVVKSEFEEKYNQFCEQSDKRYKIQNIITGVSLVFSLISLITIIILLILTFLP